MSIEHLQMVIDLLQSMGAEGKDLFIWWLALTKGIPAFFGVVWSAIGAKAIFICLGFAKEALSNNNKLNRLRDAAGVSNYFSASELVKAEKVLQEHYPKI